MNPAYGAYLGSYVPVLTVLLAGIGLVAVVVGGPAYAWRSGVLAWR